MVSTRPVTTASLVTAVATAALRYEKGGMRATLRARFTSRLANDTRAGGLLEFETSTADSAVPKKMHGAASARMVSAPRPRRTHRTRAPRGKTREAVRRPATATGNDRDRDQVQEVAVPTLEHVLPATTPPRPPG